MHRRESGDSPKAFCSAEDRPPFARASAIGITLKNSPAVLHDEHGNAPFALGIFCGARAIRGVDFCKCDCRYCDKDHNQQLACAENSGHHIAPVLRTAYQTTAVQPRIAWVAPASRVLAMASSLSRTFRSALLRASRCLIERLFRRDAETNTRDACATQSASAARYSGAVAAGAAG